MNEKKPRVPTGRTRQLLEHLQRWSKFGCPKQVRSTPWLTHNLGIRNVPDAVMKLRRMGHNIVTEIGPVKVGGIQYDAVAIYKVVG